MPEPLRPLVGVGALIFKDGKVLLGKRKNAHGAGEYASPGGHLEHMESFEDCIKREVQEEVGIEIENVRFLCVSNLKVHAPKHYIGISLLADWKSGEVEMREPDQFEHWGWYDLDQLPSPMFESAARAFEAHRSEKNYFDA